jgi:acetylornithine deacetylase/succinyl-diaminopimelate desuccinylase-like protein
MSTPFDPDRMHELTLARWRPDVLPLLDRFARIPDLSPAFQSDWESLGHLEEAATLLAEWAAARPLPGAVVEVVRLPGLTPTVVVDVPASHPDIEGTVLLYGHYDKQPPLDGWSPGRGPFTPTIDGDRLFARGVADDGYALPSALLALEVLAACGGHHARCVVLIEGSEESGSPHLPDVLAHLVDRIGTPDLVVALDSGAPTHDRFWITTSLRGAVVGTLTVTVLDHGVHSGSAGGVVPSSFRLIRQLLDRLENPVTGDLLLDELRSDPPPRAAADARALTEARSDGGIDGASFPVVTGLVLEGADPAERAVRNAWHGSVAVVGASGLPPVESAGAVLRPSTSLKLVVRLPPTADGDRAAAAIGRALTEDPPSGARVTWSTGQVAGGWAAAPFPPWLDAALDDASTTCFGAPSGRFGEGGSIPFMGWLADRFPEAHILAAGVLDPESNAHGPDESLHLPTAERVTAALGVVVDAHANRPRP